MSDHLIPRLRALSGIPGCGEAADEIEKLRDKCEAYKAQVRGAGIEIERLRGALQGAEDEIETLRAADNIQDHGGEKQS